MKAIFVFLSDVAIMAGILLSSFYIFTKSIQYKATVSRIIISVVWCLALALLYAAQFPWMPQLLVRAPFCLASIVFILILTKLKPDIVISAYLLSFGFSHVFLYIASLIAGFFSSPLSGGDSVSMHRNSPDIILIGMLIFALQLFLSYLFFRIRRFRRGFPFLFKRYAVIIALIATGAVLIFATWAGGAADIYTIPFYVSGILIIGIGLYILIRRGIKAAQRKWVKEDNEALLQQEVDGLRQELQKERAVNENLRAANHSLNHRLISMERGVVALLEKRKQEVSAEISEEFAVTIDDIRRLSREYAADVGRVKHDTVLPSTNVKTIDDLFEMFADKFASNGIRFKLTVTGSIIYMTENAIAQGKLETMIGDHLQNALIAVNTSDSSIRNVLATIGEVGDYYEFSVHDSGTPFDVDTLIRLGTERVTTHADDGGSGVGFMKTFETMSERKASMIIQENKGGVFSKSITIRFDGEKQYIIETYRPGAFPPSDRYTIIGD